MAVSHVEFLVEERSMEQALRILVPQIIPDVSYDVFAFNGKQDLLKKLPQRLNGYQHWAGSAGLGLVVLLDQDNEDCRDLKERLDRCASDAGMTCCSVSSRTAGDILNRIAIEELEAWFLGDVSALAAAYPGVPVALGDSRRFRDPDAVAGGTWEAMQRVLAKAGHHPGGLAKTRAAGEIAAHMNVDDNRSKSFQVFRDGVRFLVQGSVHAQA